VVKAPASKVAVTVANTAEIFDQRFTTGQRAVVEGEAIGGMASRSVRIPLAGLYGGELYNYSSARV